MHGNCQSGELACMLPLICLTQEQMNQLSRYAGSVKVNYQISIKEHEKYPDCRGTRHTCVYSQRTVNIVHRQIEFRKPHNANIDVEQRKEISEKKKKKKKNKFGREALSSMVSTHVSHVISLPCLCRTPETNKNILKTKKHFWWYRSSVRDGSCRRD